MRTLSPAKTYTCYHCGEHYDTGGFLFNNLSFCCAGCKAVYQLLEQNGMCGYYQLEDNPGSKNPLKEDLAYLDLPEIIHQLVDYQNNENTIVSFYIPAIHCTSCIWLLEHLYKIDSSIFSSRIDFLKKQVTISFKHQQISLRKLVELLNEIGYGPVISLQDVVKAQQSASDKGLISKIAVAGFCMGNVMLFSFPEYFGLASFEQNFKTLFGWLNLLFCLPVVFYCSKDYFTSTFALLKQRRVNLDTPLTLIIAMLFFRTAFDITTNTGPGFADTLTGLLFLLLMGKWVKQRTYHHISFERDYRSYFPIAVTKLVDGKEIPVPVNDLVTGDRILVRNGGLIPADAILMRGDGWLDMSFVTGESAPEHKVTGEVVYAGGRQTGAAIELEIVKPVAQSYLTSLWNNDGKPLERQNFNDSISKYFIIAVFAIAFASAGYWILHQDLTKAWVAFTAVIIVACPCVLTLSTPFTLSAVLAVFDKKGFYVKNTDALEQLAAVDTIIFDKTGTLTQPKHADVNFKGNLTEEESIMVASLVRHSTHPLSVALFSYLQCISFEPVTKYNEIAGMGITGMCKGVNIIVGNTKLAGLQSLPKMEGSGAVILIDGRHAATFTVQQTWRKGLGDMFKKLRPFNRHILSGDNQKDQIHLLQMTRSGVAMHFEQNPHQKKTFVSNLQAKGNKILMLGDGLNDAGAIQQSDMGIAVTDDVNAFSPGCDALMKGESLHLLPQFIQLSKNGMQIVKWSFVIAAAYNLAGVYFAVQGTLYPLTAAVLMPLSTITIILFTTVATRCYARKNKLK